METLIPYLKENYIVEAYSDKKNIGLRMLDMLYHFFTNGIKADRIIIDVYSTTYIYGISILVFLSRVFNKQYILFLHGGNLPMRHKKSPFLINFLFKRAFKVIAPSHYLKTYFEDAGFNIEYIPNIIELEHYSFLRRAFISPKLIYIRGFGKIYNPQMAVKVVAALKQTYPEVRLAMLGSDTDGNLKNVINLINELDLNDNIQIMGKLNRDEWVKLSMEYNIMLSTPTIDNTPVSIVEGMALGLVVVSTNVGGVPYLVEDQKEAILVASDDYKTMAEKICIILQQKDKCALLQDNARLKAALFSWDNIKPIWLNLLNKNKQV
jgi:glycosyltransferase involved in cell wall biosynthesis